MLLTVCGISKCLLMDTSVATAVAGLMALRNCDPLGIGMIIGWISLTYVVTVRCCKPRAQRSNLRL